MNTLRRISQHTVKAVAAGALLVAAALPLALASTAGATAGLTTPPAAPTAVVAASGLDTSGVGDATINISWAASESGANNASAALGYNVYQGTATGAESTTPLNGAVPITGTAVNVTLLTDGTPYFFVVKAVNSYGLSVASAEVTNTPAGITSAPAATVAAGNTSAVVTWTAPAKTNGSAILGYNVYVTTQAPASTTLIDPFVTALNGTATVPGTSWLNANGGMNGSTPPLCGTFTVGAAVYVPANGNDCTALGAFSAANLITGLTYTVTGLTNGTAYYFVVTAVNGVGESQGALASNVSITPGVAPLAPSGLAVSVVSGGSNLLLTWNSETSATSGFNVYEGTTAGGESATPVNAAPIGNNTSGNSYLVTGLNAKTTYFFDVAAVSPQGSSPNSLEVFATTLASVPGAPTGVAAVSNNTALKVTWTPPTVTGGSDILTYTAAAITAAGVTAGTCTNTVATDLPNTCQITGLTNGVAYSVAVKATNISGNSVASVAVSGTPAVTVPDAPTHLHVSIAGGTATLTWTQVTGAHTEGGVIAGYNVYQGTTSEGEVLVQSVGAVGTATVPVASSGTFYFEVTAVSNVGVSADSGEAYATSGATFAAAPTGLTGSAWQSSSSVGGTDSQELLSWTPPVSDGGSTITNNLVYLVLNGNVAAALGATPCGTSTSCTQGLLNSTTTGFVPVTLDSADLLVTGLTGGHTYAFAVVPVNSSGASDGVGSDALAPSNFVSVVAPNLSGAPTSVTVAHSGTNVAVSWTAPFNADGTTAVAYQVFVSAANSTNPSSGTLLPVCNGSNSPCLVSAITATSALVSGLTPGSTYVFWITATNDDPATAVANGIVVSYSAESSTSLPIIPVALPTTPSATAAAGNGYAQVTIGSLTGVLSWTATSTPGGLTCTTTTDTSCNVLGLTNGTSYTFTVTDTTLTGTSAASAPTTPAVIPTGKPGAPTGVSATSVGTAAATYNATVSWTKPSFGGLAPTAGAPYIATLANVSAATTTSFLVSSAIYADYVTNAADRAALTELVGGTGSTTSTLVAGAVQTVVSCTPALAGTVVSGTGIAVGTEVVSCTGTTLTLSAAVTATGASTLTFTGGGADALATAELLASTSLAASGSYTSALVGLGLGGFCVVPAAFLANGTDNAIANLAISDSTTCTIIGISATTPVASPEIAFVVSAQNASGLTTSSPSLPIVLSKAGTAPGAPTGVAAAASNGLVTLTWTAPTTGGSAILGYNVFVGSAAAGESTTPVNGSLLVTGTTVTIPGLTNGTKYYFIVKAVNANGTSVASSEKHATPVANPGAPTSVTASAGGANTIVLSWIAPATTGGVPLVGYLVYVGTPATSTSASIYVATPVNAALITGTTYTVTGLNSGQAYVFLIVASNGVAFSAPSGEVGAKAGTGVVIVPTVTGVYYVPTFSTNASVVVTGTGFSAGMTVASSNKDYTVTLEGLNAAGTTATLLVTTTSNATSGTSSKVTFTNLDSGSASFTLNGGPVPTPVVVGLKISGVSGTILTGRTSTFIITGTGFYGRPTITSNAAGTTAVVTHDTGKVLTVRVTVRAGTRRGVHTFTITLANGTSVQLRYSQH